MTINQRVAILIDGNNIEKSIQNSFGEKLLLKYEEFIEEIIFDRSLTRFVYFREGIKISDKFATKLHKAFYGVTVSCNKSADIPLTIEAVQLCDKVDTIILFSGDSDYIGLVKYLHSRGVRVEIAGVYSSISKKLFDVVDNVTYITEKHCHYYEFDPNYKPE